MIARYPHEHEAINAREYPGTRQLCHTCDEPTGRCEDDSIYTEDGDGPLCLECWHKTPEYIMENAKPPEGRWDYDHGPDHMREILEG